MARIAKAKELIKAATIARVTDKITGKTLGFLVKSNHTEDYYQITCLKIQGIREYFCNCPATVECCHIKAVKELCAAHHALETAKQKKEEQQAVEEAERQLAEERAEERKEEKQKPAPTPVIAAPKFTNKPSSITTRGTLNKNTVRWETSPFGGNVPM